jgi:pyruvate formate lyase activating enzyme
MNLNLLKKFYELSYASGGIIKIDFKCYDEKINLALSGNSNKNMLRSFTYLAENFKIREGIPTLVASTLLVPHYIDAIEVEKIVKFIASFDRRIPYVLLAFHPQFKFSDLHITPRKLALDCYNIAKKYLDNVRIGNIHLLGFLV